MKILKIEQNVCTQCKIMDSMLQAVPEVEEHIIKVNLDEELPEELKAEYGDVEGLKQRHTIMGTPTLLIVDEDFNEKDRVVGIIGFTPDILLEKLNK